AHIVSFSFSSMLRHSPINSPLLSFFFNDTATTEIYTLSLHDALPIYRDAARRDGGGGPARHRGDRGDGLQGAVHAGGAAHRALRSEEHTSELQSRFDLVCRLLLEKKK